MNSEEIARIAKVSRSTVSRVINNYKNVPPETRERVQSVIDKYGYTPNVSARTLAGKSNNIIGVFIADINQTNSPLQWIGANSPYNQELLAHVITSCKRRGYLTLVNTITELKECHEMEQYFSNRMLYGGIFVGFPYRTKELEDLAEKGYNIVLVDQLMDLDDKKHVMKLINTDDYAGAYEATKHLINQGHTKLVHVTGDNRLSSMERERGFLSAIKDAKLGKNSYCIIDGEYREDIAYEVMNELLKTQRPTAVFAGNDIMALGVIRAIQNHGLRVPQDIAIVGYDHLQTPSLLQLKLTSMGVSMEELAEKSVALLFSKKEKRHEVCKPILFEGKSVKL